MILLWRGDFSPSVRWTLGLVVVGTWLAFAIVLRERVVRPLQTLSNMLAALREGDYSIRARGADRDDALGLAFMESNLLGETLRAQRLGAMEATALLRTVMAEIDVAVFAFDDAERVRLVNRAGERLLAQPSERLLGRTAEQVGLADVLEGASPRTMDVTFAGGSGRWEVRRGSFRQDGRPHTLLVLSDVSRTLREEELQAWQRLVRVLSHEINNSLAPIRSIAGSLLSLLERPTRTADADEDIRRGLGVIGGRSEGLVRFMSAYARLAKLPAPNKAPLDVGAWVRRVASLETRVPVRDRRPARRRRSRPTATSSISFSSTSCETPPTRRWRRTATCVSGGRAATGRSRSWWKTRGRGWPARRICSSRSSRPSRRARASGWCSPGRSPRRTAGRSRSQIEATGGDASLRFGWSWRPVRA